MYHGLYSLIINIKYQHKTFFKFFVQWLTYNFIFSLKIWECSRYLLQPPYNVFKLDTFLGSSDIFIDIHFMVEYVKREVFWWKKVETKHFFYKLLKKPIFDRLLIRKLYKYKELFILIPETCNLHAFPISTNTKKTE